MAKVSEFQGDVSFPTGFNGVGRDIHHQANSGKAATPINEPGDIPWQGDGFEGDAEGKLVGVEIEWMVVFDFTNFREVVGHGKTQGFSRGADFYAGAERFPKGAKFPPEAQIERYAAQVFFEQWGIDPDRTVIDTLS